MHVCDGFQKLKWMIQIQNIAQEADGSAVGPHCIWLSFPQWAGGPNPEHAENRNRKPRSPLQNTVLVVSWLLEESWSHVGPLQLNIPYWRGRRALRFTMA